MAKQRRVTSFPVQGCPMCEALRAEPITGESGSVKDWAERVKIHMGNEHKEEWARRQPPLKGDG
jgi:hypothetical protein